MKVVGNLFVVTGAAGGIGGALVARLVERKARVAAVDISGERLRELKDSLGAAQSGTIDTYELDITDLEAVQALPEKVRQNQGDVDGLVNCAGVIQPFMRVKDLDYASIDRVMRVNFFGTLYMTKAFLPYLLERPRAHIVNVSSMGGFLPVPGQAIYGASKAAVKLLTEALYAELKNTNVRVTVVFPGATRTGIAEHSGVRVAEMSSRRRVPMLEPEEVAELMIRGIEKDVLYVFTGRDSKTMNFLYRVNPQCAIDVVTKNMGALLEE